MPVNDRTGSEEYSLSEWESTCCPRRMREKQPKHVATGGAGVQAPGAPHSTRRLGGGEQMVWALPGVNSQGLNSGLGKGMGQAGGASGDAWRMDRGVPAVLRNYRHLQGVAAGGVGG